MSSQRKSALEGALGNLVVEKPKPAKPATKRQVSEPVEKAPKKATKAESKARKRLKPGIAEASLYLPEDAMWQLKELAMIDRCRPHDVIVAALDLYFSQKGRPTVTELRERLASEQADDEATE